VVRVRQSHKSAVYGLIWLEKAKTRKIGARILGDYRKYLLGIRRFRKMYWTVFPGETILLANLSIERIRVSRGASKAILVKATQDSRGAGVTVDFLHLYFTCNVGWRPRPGSMETAAEERP
jgi:hypothetical protein